LTNTTGQAPPDPGPQRQVKAWLIVAGIVLGTAVLAFVFSSGFGADPRLVDSPLVGEPLPHLTLPYLERGGDLDTDELQGEILVLNFWASWCFPCRLEHEALTTASVVYEDRGVHFIGILHQDDEASAVSFLDEFGRGVNYSYVRDPDSRAAVNLGLFGVPETYFVDASGIIRARIQGEVTPASLVETIEDILAGRDPIE
jgi:cytochrome c biogenesis protein CcmG, thiol:disulfide interchange protein DsbE